MMSWLMILVVIPWSLGLALPMVGVLLKLLKVAFHALATTRPRQTLPWLPVASPIEVLR
jgi:hypothetical protein